MNINQIFWIKIIFIKKIKSNNNSSNNNKKKYNKMNKNIIVIHEFNKLKNRF